MEQPAGRARSSADPAQWPQLECPSSPEAPETSSCLDGGEREGACPNETPSASREAWTAALLNYAYAWTIMAPAEPPDISFGSDAHPARADLEETGSDESSTASAVVPVALLNAALVSAPPLPTSRPADDAEQSASDGGEATAQRASLSGGRDPATFLPVPTPVLPPTTASLTVGEAAGLLLRHSKWLASGVSHAAGAAPRLSSGPLLTHFYQYAALPTCVAPWVATVNETFTRPGSPGTGAAVSTDDAARFIASLPYTASASCAAADTSLAPPTVYRGALVLLLFHPVRLLRVWARDTLLRLVHGDAATDPRVPTAASARAVALLTIALQLLCTLKHLSALPEHLSFSQASNPVAETTATAAAANRRLSGGYGAQERVRVCVDGIFHLLTLLTAWDGQFGQAMEALTPVAAAASSPSAFDAVLGKCRATVLLLGGTLVLYGLQATHHAVSRGVLDVWRRQHRAHPLTATCAEAEKAARAADAAMAQLLRPLNFLLASNPRMPKPYAVPALAIKKTLMKVVVHALLDSASGVAMNKEEEAWRRGRLRWLWSFAAALDPPTSRVAAALPVRTAAAEAPTTTEPDAERSVLVPERSAGWLLKPLLKNASQQFQWAKAMDTAKSKPPHVFRDAEAARAAQEAAAVLDKAVYGVYMLLDSLREALPQATATAYFHDTIASYEAELVALAIGGVVHTRTAHALRLHRLLFEVDVQAFAAGAAARAAAAPTSPPTPQITAENGDADSGTQCSSGGNNAALSPFLGVPSVCLQRVWLTLPTLLVQVCKTALGGGARSSTTAAAAARQPLSRVLAHLCGALTVLLDDGAAGLCPQWLLLSPAEGMGSAPPPLQWVVQRSLRTLTDTLKDQHDLLAKAWLGLPLSGAAASLSPASVRSATAAAAARFLTEEKDLARLVYALPFAAAEDGGPRRLAEQLQALFCQGVMPSVSHSLAAEAAAWVWQRVVLTQPTLRAAVALPFATSPSMHHQSGFHASATWDVTGPAVANMARAQGRHWLTLLVEGNWSQQSDKAVRCAWWACALLTDLVPLEPEQRRLLAEDVLLALPVGPLLPFSSGASHTAPADLANGVETAERADCQVNSAPPSDTAVDDGFQTDEARRAAAHEREEGSRLYAVAQRVFVSVLRKAEQYPRAALDQLLFHLSDALPATRAARDTALRRAVQPLLVKLCPRRPEVQKSLLSPQAPAWLREWTETAVQTLNACLAEQERRFRQFEMEEETLQRESDEATRKAAWETQLRQSNQTKRLAELGGERAAHPSTLTGPSSSTGNADASKEGGASAHAPGSRVLRQQQLFPDQPLPSVSPAHVKSEDSQAENARGHLVGVKRERAVTPPPSPSSTHAGAPGSSIHGTDVLAWMRAKREEQDKEEGTDSDVVELEVDSDAEEVLADTPVLNRLAPLASPSSSSEGEKTAPPAGAAPLLKAHKTSPATAITAAPTPLQQKLRVINARQTHRVHHAEQLRQLQERLCRVAASTNLLHLQPPLMNDIIGTGSHCMAVEVPVLPEVFVSAADVLHSAASAAAGVTATTSMPFGDAAGVYAVRFAPHIAMELRCDIVRSYEDLIEGACKPIHAPSPQSSGGVGTTSRAILGHLSKPGATENQPVLSWTQRLPVHPNVPRTCIAVQSVEQSKQPPTSGGSSSSSLHDPLSLRFRIRATANTAIVVQQRAMQLQQQQQQQPGLKAVDAAVLAAAQQGLSAVLSEGDVVVVLLPLHVVAAAWVERQLGTSVSAFPAEEQEARVEAVLHSLPRSWRTLGCISQVCYVQTFLPGERTAQLCAYPPTEARTSATAAAAPLRFMHALRMGYSTAQHPFFMRKLTSLSSFQMELAALHQIDHTRLAATLYDPVYVAPQNAAFYDWVTQLLTARGGAASAQPSPSSASVLAELRTHLLLQRQLNDWQIRAIMAVLYATCPEWDEGTARRCLGNVAPRAPEMLLIEGPPGTGKTQTIGSLTLNLLHHLSRTRGTTARVLVCAPSNCAVDEALLRVVRLRRQLEATSHLEHGAGSSASELRPAYNVLSGGVLRVGVKDSVDPEVLKLAEPVFFDDVVEQRVNAAGSTRGGGGGGRGNNGNTTVRNAIRASTIAAASLIFSTLGSLHRITRQVQGLTFDVVIVDEASQGTEPAVLQAVVLAKSKCVLVGDSKQLQPTILSTDASRCGLRRSLLVRMLACGHRSFLLRTQYRMHSDICAFPNAYFYASQLLTDRSVRLRSRGGDPQDPASWTIAQKLGRCPRFVFADVPDASMERRRGRSLFNKREAAAVVQYMRQLRAFLGLTVKEMGPQLGIITFYLAQKDVIVSMLTQEERASGLQVATVDSFQGKEKRITLLSCVRTVRRSQLLRDIGQRHPQIKSADDSGGVAAYEERAENRRVGRFGLGFLADGHRLNVALTRAQDLCVCFASGESLHAVGDAVQAAHAAEEKWVAASHRLTTSDSTTADVMRQLDADDEDPLALYRMLTHAEASDVLRHPPAPTLDGPDAVEVVEAPLPSRAASACVTYARHSQLMKELTARARASMANDPAVEEV